MGNDPIATAYYNAFSASFPLAERYFIDAVRFYRDQASGDLQKQIAAFITQESMHTREHLAFNRNAIAGGYDLSRIDALLRKRFEWARSLSRLRQIASTAALEHFTTILACEAIGNPRHLETAPPEIRRLWCWHAGEEIEHKSVAFDTFMLAAQSLSPAARWRLRCSVMVSSTWYLFDFMFRGVAEFFRQDRISSFVTWLRFLNFALITPGVVRRVMGEYLRWYVPGFHPWRKDDRALIAAADETLAAP
jgi:predicted metal-dependent hydrolase